MTHESGGYRVTHIPTGLAVNTYPIKKADIASTIKTAGERIPRLNNIEKQVNDFKNTMRGD